MPEKICRLPSSPASSSKRSSLSEPSTNSQVVTLPMRRSSLAKSSMEMRPGFAPSTGSGRWIPDSGFVTADFDLSFMDFFAGAAGAAGTDAPSDSLEASTIASMRLASRRASSGATGVGEAGGGGGEGLLGGWHGGRQHRLEQA